MSQPYVTYDKFDVTNLRAGEIQEKTVSAKKGETSTQKYKELPLLYCYPPSNPQESGTVIKTLRIEFPELLTRDGITEKPGQNGKLDISIPVKLPPHGVTKKLIDMISTLHQGCAHYLYAVRGLAGMYEFNKDNATATGFKNPIFYSRDKTTGEIRAGADPTFFLKLLKRGYGASEEKTLFTDLDEKPIPWHLLKGVEMTFIPLMEVDHIYLGGGKASLQLKMISAVVTSVAKRNTKTTQDETIKRLRETNPDISRMVSEQIQELKRLYLDNGPETPEVTMEAPKPESGLTVVPPQTPSPPQQATPSMTSFMASAPIMMPAMPRVNLS